MRNMNLDCGWSFRKGLPQALRPQNEKDRVLVNFPHDYMIESDVFEEAPAGPASGFFSAAVAHYEKKLLIPQEWAEDLVFLHFDGVMMNATIEVNGSKAALQHYGYAPFTVDVTPYLWFGEENHLVITVNPSMQPNCRWYSGAGVFRSMELIHTPKVHLVQDGIYARTAEIEYDEEGNALTAFLKASAEIENRSSKNIIAEVSFALFADPGRNESVEGASPVLTRSTRIQLNPDSSETAELGLTLDRPLLWDAESPSLYRLAVSVRPIEEFRTHLIPLPEKERTTDCDSVLFGVRTIQADVRHGLRINGKAVKLRGGCLHHDNGLLGAVSVYDAEARKLSILKSIGFNAIRTTHNPPSAALIEACDRLGVYVFDEAFDAWGMGKQPGDYNQFFETDWEKDLSAFVRRDRVHPSVIIWSTGNEITERGGLGNGYTLATKLARTVRALDPSRPVSNGICSFWNGLDDRMMEEALKKMVEAASSGNIQNVDYGGKHDLTWETYTEAFTNGLDIVGYNYLENKYEHDHELFPERVILGSENYPNEIGKNWPMVESTPYVIGDFTWTAADYIGEAGIGKSVFFEPDDPILQRGPFALMSHGSSFPWRLANDADIDILGNILPQGEYRRIVFGSAETKVYSYLPENFDRVELISKWGFTDVRKRWNYGEEWIGKPIRIAVFSAADEAEVFVNGASIGRKKRGEALASGMPDTFLFETIYAPGIVEAVSCENGKEISRDRLESCGAPAGVRLLPETTCISADHRNLVYVPVEIVDSEGRLVPDAEIKLNASVLGDAFILAGFGSGNPVTSENYTGGEFHSFRGRALAIARSTGSAGSAVLTVQAEGMDPVTVTLTAAE